MRRIVPILALAILPAIAVAGDEQGKTELQQDICWQWEKVVRAPYSAKAEKVAAGNVRYALEHQGFTKFDYALDLSPSAQRHQQLCERYFDRYSGWPTKCCAVAPMLRGSLGDNSLELGRADRKKRLTSSRQ